MLSINIFNVLPGCLQISRANPKRPQLLKRGFVLETHRRHLSRSRAVSACHERPPRPSRSGAVSACSVPRARLAWGRFRPVTSVPRARLARGRFPHVTSVHRASLAPVSLWGGFPGAVSACHERPPRQSRSGAVSASHKRPPAPVSLAGGFCLS